MKNYLIATCAILITTTTDIGNAANIEATYAEAPLSSCPITTAEYVIVDAYTNSSSADHAYLPTFKEFTDSASYAAPHYDNIDSISFYHINSNDLQAAQACFGTAISGPTTTLAFKNGKLLATVNSTNMIGNQLYQFLHNAPVSLELS